MEATFLKVLSPLKIQIPRFLKLGSSIIQYRNYHRRKVSEIHRYFELEMELNRSLEGKIAHEKVIVH